MGLNTHHFHRQGGHFVRASYHSVSAGADLPGCRLDSGSGDSPLLADVDDRTGWSRVDAVRARLSLAARRICAIHRAPKQPLQADRVSAVTSLCVVACRRRPRPDASAPGPGHGSGTAAKDEATTKGLQSNDPTAPGTRASNGQPQHQAVRLGEVAKMGAYGGRTPLGGLPLTPCRMRHALHA
jgi:hypothetical protein